MTSYYDYHYPLSLYEILKELQLEKDQGADLAVREWYSQPRPMPGAAVVARDQITVFDVGGTIAGAGGYDGTEKPYWKMDELVSAPNVTFKVVPYPAEIPFVPSYTVGIANLIALINETPGSIILTGSSQGAIVISKVYDEFRYGSLQSRRSDLLAGFTFGSPARPAGHTWPGGYDPGGQGIETWHLEDPEDLWWDMANPGDIITTTPLGADGMWMTAIIEMLGNYAFEPASLVELFLHPPGNILDLIQTIGEALGLLVSTLVNGNAHEGYGTIKLPGFGMPAAQIVANRINEIALARPLQTQTVPATTEVLQVNFKLPLSVSELTFEVLRVPCQVEVWYRDRQNNWRPALDEQRQPVKFAVSGSNVKAWFKYHTGVYPVVAKSLQFRFTRLGDVVTYGTQPIVVGMRNALIRRNVYDRAAGQTYFEDEQDVLGNVVSKYVKDWDASRAYDEDPGTYWKSAAQPDPQAVVSLYLDVRAKDGQAQMIDRLYLDPVYSGQNLNIYYSCDDAVTTRKPSPVGIPPADGGDVLTEWKPDRGRYDMATGTDESYYRVPFSLGPLTLQPAWVGVEWAPSFGSASPPAGDPVLLRALQEGTTEAWRPALHYDGGAKAFVLSFTNGETTRTYETPALSRDFTAGEPLRVAAGWAYGTDKVRIRVCDRGGNVLAELDGDPTNLPRLVSLDGQLEFNSFRGTFTSHVVKLEDWGGVNGVGGAADYLANPMTYVSPEPTLPDDKGRIPSSTLDNAVYYADWTLQQHGAGGPHETHYEDKEWVPVWRDYITEKGMLFFPETYSAKYIKLEFSNLTEEPYPIWESGIQVQYKVFPVSVVQQSSQGPRLYTGSGGFLGLGTLISLNGVRSVNWLNPGSIVNAVNSVFGKTVEPVQIQAGPGYVTDALPNMGVTNVVTDSTTEATSAYVYRREELSPYVIAQSGTDTIIKAEGLQKIAAYTDVPWSDIEAANQGTISHKQSAGALPIRGTDWWVFPGQTLKIPAAVMTKLTDTSTVLERKLTTERRIRFNTVSVHRYETRTVTRDAAIGYFAGVREVFPLVSTHILDVDEPEYNFTQYDQSQWVFTNVWQLKPTSPIDPLTALEQQTLAFLWDAQGNPKAPQAFADIYAEVSSTTNVAESYLMTVLDDLRVKNLVRRVASDTDFYWAAVVNHDKIVSGPITTPGNPYKVPNDSFITGIQNWEAVGAWSWDDTMGYAGLSQRGCAMLDAAGATSSLTSKPVAMTAGDHITVSAWVRWDQAASSAGAAIRLKLVPYDSDGVAQSPITPTGGKATITHPVGNNGTTDLFNLLTGNYVVPAGTAALAVQIAVDAGVSAGKIRVDSAWIYPQDPPMARAYKSFRTLSRFGKVKFDFRDSGPVRSDSMWLNPGSDQLAYYVTLTSIPPGFWSDFTTKWTDTQITWGSPFPLVAITLDPDRVYDGKRVLHFRRGTGAGQCGIKVRQWNNYVGWGLARICVVAQKPYANNNTIILRLRRVSDGVIVYEESVKPPVGSWWNYQTRWVQVPAGPDQVYNVEMSMSGDQEDQIFLSDLYTEVSHVRYFARLGSANEAVMHEVTDLRNAAGRYAGTAYVTSTLPVNEFSIETRIMSPKAWAYGCTATPNYLR